jgi:hypothetical protein
LRHFGLDAPGTAGTASGKGAGDASGLPRNVPEAEGPGTS